jgi:iron complex outermembrane recepter protein
VLEGPLAGRRMAQDPRHRATAAVTFDDARIGEVTAQVRHLGRQFEDDQEMLPMGGATLVDARVARAIGRGVSAFLSVQNVTDRRYVVGRAGVDTVGAPRTVELGLTYR